MLNSASHQYSFPWEPGNADAHGVSLSTKAQKSELHQNVLNEEAVILKIKIREAKNIAMG